MNHKELAQQFYSVYEEASDNIINIFAQEGCSYSMDSTSCSRGIRIDFLFRNEVDYFLVVPWEYTQDDNKIKDYYKRFKAYTEKASCIPEIDRLGCDFMNVEFKQLKEAKCLNG